MASGKSFSTAGQRPKKKKKVFRRIVALVLIGAILYTGFKEPGFFLKNPKTNFDWLYQTGVKEKTGKETRAESDYDDSVKNTYSLTAAEEFMKDWEVTQENAPGSVSLIDVRISENERQNAKTGSYLITKDEPVCTVGDVTVDFGKWNIEEDDVFTLRTIGERRSEGSASTLFVYDFAMESGRHEFPTEVTITMPRKAGDRDGRPVWFDETTGEWKPLAFSVSDDGSYYTIYTDHFCDVAEQISDAERMASENPEKLCILHAQLTYSDGKPAGLLDRAVKISHEDVHKLFFNEKGVIGKVTEYGGIHAEALIPATFEEAFEWEAGADVVNTTLGFFADGTSGIGDYFVVIGGAITLGKIGYQIEHNPKVLPVLWENRWGIIGTATGVAGMAAGSAIGSVAAFPFAALGLACYFIPKLEESEFLEPKSHAEYAYRSYLDKWYRSPRTNSTLTLTEANGWANELRHVMDQHLSDPQNTAAAVEAVYEEYLESWWHSNSFDKNLDITDEEKFEFKYRARNILYRNTKPILYDIAKTYMHKAEESLQKELEPLEPILNKRLIFRAVDPELTKEQSFDESQYAMKKDLKGKIVQFGFERGVNLFDDQYRFSYRPAVIDLYDPNDRYVYFKDQTPVEFWPQNTDVSEYGASAYVPHAVKNSNMIFQCRMYNYLQIGSPKVLVFEGNGLKNYPEQEVEIEVPKLKAETIDVKALLGMKDINPYMGYWLRDEPDGEQWIVGVGLDKEKQRLAIIEADAKRTYKASTAIDGYQLNKIRNVLTLRSSKFVRGFMTVTLQENGDALISDANGKEWHFIKVAPGADVEIDLKEKKEEKKKILSGTSTTGSIILGGKN